MSRERTRLQPPSGYVLETTTLIDAIIMTSEKNKKKKNREKKLRTLSLSLHPSLVVAIPLGPRIVYVFFFCTHTHKRLNNVTEKTAGKYAFELIFVSSFISNGNIYIDDDNHYQHNNVIILI
jgi:hypothetical protein